MRDSDRWRRSHSHFSLRSTRGPAGSRRADAELCPDRRSWVRSGLRAVASGDDMVERAVGSSAAGRIGRGRSLVRCACRGPIGVSPWPHPPQEGVCLRFHEAVPGLDPLGLFRHPAVTLGVDDVDRFVQSVDDDGNVLESTANSQTPGPQSWPPGRCGGRTAEMAATQCRRRRARGRPRVLSDT